MSSSSVDQLFTDRVRSGERVRCCVVTGPGGHGKTHHAERLAAADLGADMSSQLLVGDIADASDLGDADVVIVDVAELAPAQLLKQLRADALDTSSTRSLLVFARQVTGSPELAELAALADRDGRLAALEPLSVAEVADRIPPASGLDAKTMLDLTSGIPVHVDRLCAAWDDEGWPTAGHLDAAPDRFVRHVGAQVGRLGRQDRVLLAKASITQDASGAVEQKVMRGLIDAGLADASGRVPDVVAMSLPTMLDPAEWDEAVAAGGAELLVADPHRAALLAESASSPPPWTVAALAAAGRFDDATRMLETVGHVDGWSLAAAAHVAAAQSRWEDASAHSSAIREHPYWSEARTNAVARAYRTLGGERIGVTPDVDAAEPTAAFIDEAAAALDETFGVDVDVDQLGSRLRALVRRSSDEQPLLDVAVSPSELAAVAALLSGEFDVARALVEKSPEVSARSGLNEAFSQWVTHRSGTRNDTEPPTPAIEGAGSALPAAEVLELASRVLDARRTGDLADQVGVLERVRDVGASLSVDVLTFDALCELHLGAQRIDARQVARQMASGIDALVDRLGEPALWNLRRLWNRVESAVAAGDLAALESAASAMSGLPDVGPTNALSSAARQWVRVLGGQIDRQAVERCLDELEAHGYVWEAAGLAGQAAIRTSNAELAKVLLARGRDYREAAPEQVVTSPAGLSEREIEIGQLVLLGHSYKEIGAMCFISPKTVEHHIAHIRQKLSAVGVPRAEFRAALEADLRPG